MATASGFHYEVCLGLAGVLSVTCADPSKEQALGFIDFFLTPFPPLSSLIPAPFYLPACYHLKLLCLCFLGWGPGMPPLGLSSYLACALAL